MFVQINDNEIVNTANVIKATYRPETEQARQELVLIVAYPEGSATVHVDPDWAVAAWSRLMMSA